MQSLEQHQAQQRSREILPVLQNDELTLTVVINSNEDAVRLIYRDVDWKTAVSLTGGRYGYRLIFGRSDLIKV